MKGNYITQKYVKYKEDKNLKVFEENHLFAHKNKNYNVRHNDLKYFILEISKIYFN